MRCRLADDSHIIVVVYWLAQTRIMITIPPDDDPPLIQLNRSHCRSGHIYVSNTLDERRGSRTISVEQLDLSPSSERGGIDESEAMAGRQLNLVKGA